MKVKGHGGTIKTNRKDYGNRYVEVWFYEKATANILALKNVKRKLIVTYDGKMTDYS